MSDKPTGPAAVMTRKVDRMTFEVYQRDTPRKVDPSVTLESHGRISVNGAAARLLGQPAQVELMYDPQFRAVGLWATKDATGNTFKAVRGHADEDARKLGFSVSATSFFRHINLDIAESKRFKPVIEDGVLYFLLDQGSPLPARTKQVKG